MLSREEMVRRGEAQGELSKAERFAADALGAFRNHPVMELIDEFVMFIAGCLEQPFLKHEHLEILTRAVRLVKTIQTEAIPAAYAIIDSTVNDRVDVLERYREEVLNLPAVFRPTIPLRVSSAETWRYAPALWEALNEKRWIEADSPNKYISAVSRKKLEQRQAEEEREHTKAGHEGGQLVQVEDLALGVELVDEAPCPAKPVTDLSGLPIPEDVMECVEMARNGHTWAEIAAHLGTDTRHLIEKVRRLIEVLPPNAAAALKDQTNFERYAPFIYAQEVATLTANLRTCVITKRPIADAQKPDPTRAHCTGQSGKYARVWLSHFNDKLRGNSDFPDTNSLER